MCRWGSPGGARVCASAELWATTRGMGVGGGVGGLYCLFGCVGGSWCGWGRVGAEEGVLGEVGVGRSGGGGGDVEWLGWGGPPAWGRGGGGVLGLVEGQLWGRRRCTATPNTPDGLTATAGNAQSDVGLDRHATGADSFIP